MTVPLTLNAQFAHSIHRRGEALAVADAQTRCSYRELDLRSDALARALRRRGVRRDEPVVIFAERSVASVVAMVAVLRAGGAFVPVSLDTPLARLAFILRDAGPKVLLVDEIGRCLLQRATEPLDLAGIDTLALDVPPAPPAVADADEPLPEVAPGDLAYIIYTSGTSGHPKGVMIEHGSIARRFHDWDAMFGFSGTTPRILQVARFGFDVFLADVVKAFGAGGVLLICPSEAVIDPARLYRWLIDEAIDYIDMVPAVLRTLVEYLEASGQDLATVRILNCGADQWTRKEYLHARTATRVGQLYNGYGVTECAVENTLFRADTGTTLDEWSTLPIGRAMPSDRIHILDDALQPVPPGVTGQICIGGPCVARGYLNRPDLNASAFFVDQGDRFYQTGDLGRMTADGIIEFLGRRDFQIKVNGHRIELEEIESVLERLPAVAQAIVCVDPERQILTACLRIAGDAPLPAAESIALAARHLPHYMVPGRVVAVERFPVTPNGKVDRLGLARELAAMTVAAPAQGLPPVHGSRTGTELRARLAQRDVDLLALAHEFIKPGFAFALIVVGDFAAGTASATSALDLLILLDDARALKRRRPDVAGHPVRYDSTPDEATTRLTVSLAGLEIRLSFAVADAVAGASGELAAGWILCGQEMVERLVSPC